MIVVRSHGFPLPLAKTSVRVDRLHPLLAYRVSLMLADPRMKGYRLISGVRTYDDQVRLYEGWRNRLAGYNLAANPYRKIRLDDGLVVNGSYHVTASDGQGYAVDLRKPVTHSVAKAAKLIGSVALGYGLKQVALHAGGKRYNEWWHLQHRDRYGVFGGPVIPPPPVEPSTKGTDMLIQVGFLTWLNEGWRYRFLSDPATVAAYADAGVPRVELPSGSWKVLRAEAQAVGRLSGEPADVAAIWDA